MPIDVKIDSQSLEKGPASDMPHKISGRPMQLSNLFEEKIFETPSGPRVFGVKSPEGRYYPFTDGEQMVYVREGNDRKPYVRLKDGSQVTFSAWEIVRQDNIREIFESIDPQYAKLYQYLLADHPELDQLGIEIATREQYPVLDYTGGFFRHPDATNPNPRIFVEASGTKHYEHLLIERELSARLAAEMIGIDFSVLQQHPQILSMFIFLHEIGHGDDYIKNYLNNPSVVDAIAKKNEIRGAEMLSLPMRGRGPSYAKKMVEKGELDEFYQKYRLYYEDMGILSSEMLLIENERAYRNLPSESYADNFAAETLRNHWTDMGFEEYGSLRKVE